MKFSIVHLFPNTLLRCYIGLMIHKDVVANNPQSKFMLHIMFDVFSQ